LALGLAAGFGVPARVGVEVVTCAVVVVVGVLGVDGDELEEGAGGDV